MLLIRCELARIAQLNTREKEDKMFLILAVVLVLLWVGGFTVLHVTGFLIHLLLICAVIMIVLHFVTGRRTV